MRLPNRRGEGQGVYAVYSAHPVLCNDTSHLGSEDAYRERNDRQLTGLYDLFLPLHGSVVGTSRLCRMDGGSPVIVY